jgi:hypothetical protein
LGFCASGESRPELESKEVDQVVKTLSWADKECSEDGSFSSGFWCVAKTYLC